MRPLGGLLCLMLAAGVPAGRAAATDRIDLPPAERAMRSASGRFQLTLFGAPKVAATLRETRGGKAVVRWTVPLPHERGPRTAVVADTGAVLLIDEWINAVPRHALMVIDPRGRIVADHSGEQLFAAVGGPRPAITANARFGTWRSSEAMLSADQKSVTIGISTRAVRVSLADGSLAIIDRARAER